MKSLGLVKGLLFIEALLRKIEIEKEQFTLEIEMGKEVLIPRELSMNDFPVSFQFYDCILNVLDATISYERKEIFYLRNHLNLKKFKENNALYGIKQYLNK